MADSDNCGDLTHKVMAHERDGVSRGKELEQLIVGTIDCRDEAISCDNLVTILGGNRPILGYSGALTCGCNSLKMLVDVAKCDLALDGSTGLRNKWWKTEIDVSRRRSSLSPDLQVW